MTKKLLLIGINIAFAIVFFLILIFLAYVAVNIKELYEDFDAQLPLITKILVSYGNLFANFWYIIAPIILIFLSAVSTIIGTYLARFSSRRLVIIYGIGGFIFFVVMIILAGSIYIPFQQLTSMLH